MELFLLSMIKAIPLKVFGRWGGKRTFFQKGVSPQSHFTTLLFTGAGGQRITFSISSFRKLFASAAPEETSEGLLNRIFINLAKVLPEELFFSCFFTRKRCREDS